MNSRASTILLSLSAALAALAGCTPQGEVVSKTDCSAAIATATYSWDVAYFPERFRNDVNRHRIETFASATIENRNGQQPGGNVIGPDDDGVWWPTLPPRPTADEVDERREDDFRYNDPPELQRSVNYVLQCKDGKFLADKTIYRRVGKAIASGQTIRAQYALGQLLNTEIVESGETLAPPPEANPDSTPESTSDTSSGSAQASESTILYVDPATGNDGNNGGTGEPFRTITQAIARAQSGQTIQLTSGTYDQNSGETFPLTLKPGVSLLGNVSEQGKGITITGGGNFLSKTWAKQNVGIVAVDESTVKGITLGNPNTRGTAVWVEAGSPTIANNVFTGNNREGVFVSGTATPQILSNLIKDNGGNGVSFTRGSGGLLAGNSIRTSGYGVAVSDDATPTLEANQIIQNRSGIVISGRATPLLRGNTISDNEQDGIVATTDAQPTLEENVLVDNGEFDVNSNSTLSVKSVEDLSQLKVQGKVEKQ